ncbi:MAG: D-glucuronyl C5-epimerase family protein [Thermoproteota archaeon]
MYREVANQALKSFLVPVEQGGVRLDTEDGWWYEEYADPGGRNPRVLNGMIFALEGIYDFWLITGDDMARVIFEKGILALRAELPRYDAWGWSYYDALGNIASDKYHRFHVRQMKWLFLVTGDPIYARYAEDWEDDLVSPFRFVSLILIRGPQESDLVLLFCNMTAIFLTIQAGHWAILKIKARLPEVRRRDTSRTIDSC